MSEFERMMEAFMDLVQEEILEDLRRYIREEFDPQDLESEDTDGA